MFLPSCCFWNIFMYLSRMMSDDIAHNKSFEYCQVNIVINKRRPNKQHKINKDNRDKSRRKICSQKCVWIPSYFILFNSCKKVLTMQPPGVPEPAGAFWGCVVVAVAIVFGAVTMSRQSGRIAHHMMTTMTNQGDRVTNTCERMTNTSERLAMAIAHHTDRMATTGERLASVAESIDINVNMKHVGLSTFFYTFYQKML